MVMQGGISMPSPEIKDKPQKTGERRREPSLPKEHQKNKKTRRKAAAKRKRGGGIRDANPSLLLTKKNGSNSWWLRRGRFKNDL